MKLLESSLLRGGAVRSSLHTLTSNNNTSTPTRRIDKPAAPQPPQQTQSKEGVGQTTTDVASVVNLGGAGSRRTVYLVDGNQIKADRSPTSSINLGANATTSSEAANSSPHSTNGATIASGADAAGGATPPATTLLMYNRISNIIAPLSEGSGGGVAQSEKFGSSTGGSQNNSNKGSLEDKEKESAIWYEYGCV